MIKLSVVVPAYNVEQYIEKCLLSVISNDLPHAFLEIIVVDDESPDKSVEVVQPLAHQYPFLRIISQKNAGLGGARNTGIKNATGAYILFLDSDDWVLENTLNTLVTKAMELDADVYEFSAQGVDPAGKVVYQFSANSGAAPLDGITYYNQIRYMNSACNKLYRRELLVDNGLYFLERIYIEDFEFNTRLLLKAKRVFATDFLVSQFLQSPDSITRNTSPARQKKMVDDIFRVLTITQSLFQSHPQSDASDRFFKERLGFIVATVFYQLFKNKADFSEVENLGKTLREQQLMYVDFPIHQRNKDWFRRLFLQHFFLFRIAHQLNRMR